MNEETLLILEIVMLQQKLDSVLHSIDTYLKKGNYEKVRLLSKKEDLYLEAYIERKEALEQFCKCG